MGAAGCWLCPGGAPLVRALTLSSRERDSAASRPPLRQRPAGTRRRGIRGANRRPSGQASAAGGRGLTRLRSSPPGWRSPAGAGQVTRPPHRARRWSLPEPLAAAARPRARARSRSCPVHGGQAADAAGRRNTARRRHRAGPGVRGLQVTGGEGVHHVTAAASAAARPGIWPGGLHRAPAVSAGCAALRAP